MGPCGKESQGLSNAARAALGRDLPGQRRQSFSTHHPNEKVTSVHCIMSLSSDGSLILQGC